MLMQSRAKRGAVWLRNRSGARSSVICETISCAALCSQMRRSACSHIRRILRSAEPLFSLSSHREQDRRMEGAGRRDGRGIVRTGACSAQSRRRNVNECRYSRTERDRQNTQRLNFCVDGKRETVEARFLLVNFGRNVLAKFTGRFFQPDRTDEGSVFKINMLLSRLPKLKAKKYPATEAFCGTFHSDEGYRANECQL